MKHFICLLFCGLFLLTMSAQTGNQQNILFILDASGSMAGKIDKGTKIQVAKETIGKLADKIAADAHVGLIAYGHRSASDCNDIQTLVPVGVFDKAKFVSVVKALTIKGKTPIANSINQTLALIRGINDPVTIILLSDGLETCEGNACEAIKGAKAAGVKITMHVVGFGMAEKDLSPLECLAQAGGGQYFPANSAAELASALEQTVEEIPAGNAFLSVKTVLEGKLTDATVKVVKKGDPKPIANGRTYESPETNPRIFQIPAGKYDVLVQAITIRTKPTQPFENIEIGPGDTLYKEVSFDQGVVEFLVTRNGQLSDGLIHLYEAGTNKIVTSTRSYTQPEKNPVRLNVPPGMYDIVLSAIEISGKPETKIFKKELGSGGNLKFTHNFESGELSIGAKKGSEYVDATLTIVDIKTGKNVGAGRTYQRAENNPKKFILEPGNYRIDLGPVKPAGLIKKSIVIDIKANSSIENIVEW